MQADITISFDEYGQTTLIQNGLVFSLSIKQRLALCSMVTGSVPEKQMIGKEFTVQHNGYLIEEQ